MALIQNTTAVAIASSNEGMQSLLCTIYDELAKIRKMLGCASGGSGAGILIGSKTWDPGAVADSTAQTTTTLTVTGALVGDLVLCAFSLTLAGVTLSAYVSAADTVTFKIDGNTSGGSVNLASGTVSCMVIPQAAMAQALTAMVLSKT